MKARIGDYINPPDRDPSGRMTYNPSRVVALDGSEGYVLENGSLVADSEITNDDVLLESEIF